MIFGKKGTPSFHARLHRGSFEKHYKIGGESVSFEWMKCLKGSPAGPDHAIAYYLWAGWAGSSSSYGVVQLLHIEAGRLKVVQQILFNTRGSGKAGAFLNVKSGTLTIRGVNDREHCCPTGLDVVQFELKAGLFKQTRYGKAPFQ